MSIIDMNPMSVLGPGIIEICINMDCGLEPKEGNYFITSKDGSAKLDLGKIKDFAKSDRYSALSRYIISTCKQLKQE